jgi:hypothetical protein
MIDVRDDSYTGRSPCLTCPRHLQGLDKKNCIDICKRLKAYRNGKSWENEKVEQIDDEILMKQAKQVALSIDTLQKTKKKGGTMPEEEKTSVKRNEDEDDIDKIVDDIADRIDSRQGTKIESWKQKICVICHDETKAIIGKRSQTCGACYQAWNTGKIDHPTLGKFKVSLTKSKIEETSQVNRDNVFKVYLTEYPEIMQYIVETARKSLLSTKDVFVQLLSEAIIARKKKEDKS